MERKQLELNIQSAVAEVLRVGNSAPKVYVRIRPSGDVEVSEETNWCCSPDEYYKQVPHTLSLEILKSTRDYSSLDEQQVEECAEMAVEAASEILESWEPDITAWIEAGNLNAATAEYTVYPGGVTYPTLDDAASALNEALRITASAYITNPDGSRNTDTGYCEDHANAE